MLPDPVLVLAQGGDGFVRDPSEGATSCVAENDTVCIGWAFDNFDRWVTPTLEHLLLVSVSVAAGFLIAFGLALLSHGRRWLVPTFVGVTGVLYTIPSIALFLILLPITGRGTVTAIIALTLYNLQIIYRNIVTGLANVPEASRDAGRGMGMTKRQLLWRVELPLAVPEIIAGLRIATVSTVAIATLAIFAGAGGLGEVIYTQGLQNDVFKTAIVVGSGIAIAMAVAFDAFYLTGQRVISPWRTVRPV
ncbi:MAG TPA: ABC transporter permease [Solirubrobacterales bacterium]|nr:ABC transporter permease [Solirubrobacterales bacterium]